MGRGRTRIRRIFADILRNPRKFAQSAFVRVLFLTPFTMNFEFANNYLVY